MKVQNLVSQSVNLTLLDMHNKVEFSSFPKTTMKTLQSLLLITIVSLMTQATTQAAEERFFEMRTYITNDGKLCDLHKRFRDHTNKLFVKHGMQLVGYWTPSEGDNAENTLVYILAYPNREARDTSWKAFRDDPVWQKAYKQSHIDAGGKIVKKVESVFLNPTDYSPIK